MARALLFRIGLALVALLTAIGFGFASSPRPPWIPFVVVLSPFLAIFVTMSMFGDRRLMVRTGREDAPWLGDSARWCEVTSRIESETAPRLAAEAIANVGGRQVQIIHDSVAVGWIGLPWEPHLLPTTFQLSVVTTTDESGNTTFTCCARPRWAFATMGSFMSRRLADSLEQEVRRLIGK
jgi:hypothetical protein